MLFLCLFSVVFISALGLFLLPAFTFSSPNIAYCRLLKEQHTLQHICPLSGASYHLSLLAAWTQTVLPWQLLLVSLPLFFLFVSICFFFFLIFFLSAGKLSAAEAAEGAQHGGAPLPSHAPLLPRPLQHCCAHRPPCGEGQSQATGPSDMNLRLNYGVRACSYCHCDFLAICHPGVTSVMLLLVCQRVLFASPACHSHCSCQHVRESCLPARPGQPGIILAFSLN